MTDFSTEDLDQNSRSLLKKLNRQLDPNDPNLMWVNKLFASYHTEGPGGRYVGARAQLIKAIVSLAKDHGVV